MATWLISRSETSASDCTLSGTNANCACASQPTEPIERWATSSTMASAVSSVPLSGIARAARPRPRREAELQNSASQSARSQPKGLRGRTSVRMSRSPHMGSHLMNLAFFVQVSQSKGDGWLPTRPLCEGLCCCRGEKGQIEHRNRYRISLRMNAAAQCRAAPAPLPVEQDEPGAKWAHCGPLVAPLAC
jgi:hypothetical protein